MVDLHQEADKTNHYFSANARFEIHFHSGGRKKRIRYTVALNTIWSEGKMKHFLLAWYIFCRQYRFLLFTPWDTFCPTIGTIYSQTSTILGSFRNHDGPVRRRSIQYLQNHAHTKQLRKEPRSIYYLWKNSTRDIPREDTRTRTREDRTCRRRAYNWLNVTDQQYNFSFDANMLRGLFVALRVASRAMPNVVKHSGQSRRTAVRCCLLWNFGEVKTSDGRSLLPTWELWYSCWRFNGIVKSPKLQLN